MTLPDIEDLFYRMVRRYPVLQTHQHALWELIEDAYSVGQREGRESAGALLAQDDGEEPSA